MAGLGTISGQIRLDVRQAVAAYAAVRAANAATVFALRGSSAAFIAAGSAATAGGLAIAAGFAYAIKAAAEFERRLDFFGAVSASTEADMERVRAKALELGKDTIYSANQIADSFIELGKAGVSSQQIIDGIGEAVANLGAAADIPLDTAAQIMTSAIQTYELRAQDAVRVTDLLAGAANASIVEVEDLGVSLKYVGGVAHAVSIPLEDTITALGLLGKAGIRGSTAGTSLRQIIVSLSGTSKKAQGVLKDLGIVTADGGNKFFTAEGKAKSLSEVFQVLNEHTAHLTEAQRLAAFKTIFNNRALSAAAILTNAGADGFAAMNAEIGKTTAADVAAKRLDNLSGDIEILKGNLETLAIEAGSPFQEVARQVVQFVTSVVQAFANLDPGTQKIIFQMIALAGAFLLIAGPIALFIGMILGIVGQFLKFGAAVRFAAGLLGPLVTAIAGLLGIGVAPFLLIVAGVALVIAGLVLAYKKSETFRNFLAAIGNGIVAAWGGFIAFFQGLPAMFSSIWSSITSGATAGWDAVATFFTSTVPSWFSGLASTVGGALSSFFGSIGSFFSSLPGRIGGFLSNLVSTATSALSGLASAAATGFMGFIAAANTFLGQLPGRIAYWFGFAVGFAIRILGTFAMTVAVAIIRVVQAIVNGLQALPGLVIGFFTTMGEMTIAAVIAMINAIVFAFTVLPMRVGTWLQQMAIRGVQIVVAFAQRMAIQGAILVARFLAFIQQLPGRVQNFFQTMAGRAIALVMNMAARVGAAANQMVSRFIGFIQQLPGRVQAILARMVQVAITTLQRLATGAGNAARGAYSALASGLAGIPGLVGGLFDRAVAAISGVASRAMAAARNVASNMWNGFKAGLGISSPSFIERAAFAINDTVTAETKALARNTRIMQGVGDRFGNSMVTPLAAATLSMASELEAQRRLTAQASRLGVATASNLPTGLGTRTATPTAVPVTVQAPAMSFPETITLDVDGQQFTAYVRGVSGEQLDDTASSLYAGRR